MNWIDLLLIVIVLLAIWTGWRKGFILGMLDLVTWVGSILAGFFFYRYLASFLEKKIPALGVWTLPVAFITTILIAQIILSLLKRSLLKATPEKVHNDTLNQFLGIVPGAISGAINATIVAALLLALPISDSISTNTRNSKIANKLAYQSEWLEEKLSPIFDAAIRRSMNKLTVEPESEKSIELHYTVANPKVREDMEFNMLGMVNEERAKNGLDPLKADPQMAEVARAHSRDMFARGYFSHVTPEGKTLADRVQSFRIPFRTAGENLALGPTLVICHEGLMNSPGHKANILHVAFGRVGIGVLDGGKYGLMITQNFRN
ncbi:MAG: CvpA family protein [Chitinophagaceae bacterium]|nr:CvpA family protein [Chitinophagaceae bacterium]